MRKLMVLGLLLLVGSAHAKVKSTSTLAEARAHFRTGEELFRAGAYERAVKEYLAAYELAPRPGLLFNLGSAYRKKAEATSSVEDKKTALDYYRKYLDAEPRGKVIEDAMAFVASLRREIDEEAAVAPRPPPEPAPGPAPAPVALPPEPAPVSVAPIPVVPPAEASVRDGGGRFRIAGMVTAGVGVALVATGVYFGLKARSAASDIDALKDGWDQGLYDSGQSAQRNMYICAGAGAAAIAGGAILYFVLGKPDEPPAVTLSPSLSPESGGLVVSGRF